jgi:hypothetical protein
MDGSWIPKSGRDRYSFGSDRIKSRQNLQPLRSLEKRCLENNVEEVEER